jgi:hypothetical protein
MVLDASATAYRNQHARASCRTVFTVILDVKSRPGGPYDLACSGMTEISLGNGTIFHDFELKISDHVVGDLTYDADLCSRSWADALWADMTTTLLGPTFSMKGPAR